MLFPPCYEICQVDVIEAGRFCRICVNYRKGGLCDRYDCSVDDRGTCLSWERNWNAEP